jgi:hypothetical protein
MISERDYLKMRTEIENRCRLDLEALDRVWSMAHRGEPPPQKAKPQHSSNAIPKTLDIANTALEIATEALNKRATVRAAVQSLSGEFGSKDVRTALERISPEASAQISDNQLSSIIARLAELSEIHAVTPKSGRTPAIYAHGPRSEEVRAS